MAHSWCWQWWLMLPDKLPVKEKRKKSMSPISILKGKRINFNRSLLLIPDVYLLLTKIELDHSCCMTAQ